MADSEDYSEEATPTAHKTSHQDGGTDEISIAALSGTPAALAAHALLPTIHQDAPALIGVHALLASIHHVRYTDVEAAAAAAALITIHAAVATAHQDAPNLILTHKGDASAHHAKYTDANARAAVVEDEAYAATWDADTTHAASKNALYDEIQLQLKALLTAKGDIGYASAPNTLARLAIGTANHKLFANAAGDSPEWAVGVKLISTTRDTAVASGDQNVTGFGFQPSHVVILAIVDGTAELSISFHNGTSNLGLANMHEIASAQWTLGSGIFLVQSATQYYQGLVAMIADGITISWIKTGAKTGTAQLYLMGWR